MLKFSLKIILEVIRLLWQSATAKTKQVTATKILDGDSFLARDPEGQTHHVRIRGVDAPEILQKGGPEAKKEMENLIKNKTLFLIDPETDKYGRIAAFVETEDGTDAAEHLAKKGLAWACPHHGLTKHSKAQKKAQSKNLGIWKEKNPQKPWHFRKENTPEI